MASESRRSASCLQNWSQLVRLHCYPKHNMRTSRRVGRLVMFDVSQVILKVKSFKEQLLPWWWMMIGHAAMRLWSLLDIDVVTDPCNPGGRSKAEGGEGGADESTDSCEAGGRSSWRTAAIARPWWEWQEPCSGSRRRGTKRNKSWYTYERYLCAGFKHIFIYICV